jgi:acyl phosphate:glycerol-3-phosphate acyltransferase
LTIPEVVSLVLAGVAGYLLGGIPFGIVVSRIARGPDPRTVGSGRTGGANVSRALGFRWAIASGGLDVAKASVAVILVAVAGGGLPAQVIAALAAIVGHSRSPYIGFRGGRGVAPAVGGLVVLAPLVVAVIVPLFLAIVAVTRISSLGSLLASAAGGAALILLTAVTGLSPVYDGYGVAAVLLIWAFHRDNIARLLSGTERRIGERGRSAS